MTETAGVAELTAQEAQQLGTAHPEIESVEAALVIGASRPVLDKIRSVAERMLEEASAEELLLSIMAKENVVRMIDEHRLVQLKRQSDARSWFRSTFRCLSSHEVAEVSGSEARNSAAKANRLKSEGRLFAMTGPKGDLFPLFQFDDEGAPRPVIADVLRSFRGKSSWAVALWFVSVNGWLNGHRPVDLLDSDPELVVSAAARGVEPFGA